VFVRFEGEGEGGQHCLPYFIALDHGKRAVVVAIRGTLALQHTVTGASPRVDGRDVHAQDRCAFCWSFLLTAAWQLEQVTGPRTTGPQPTP
jgi:hypothetical protein